MTTAESVGASSSASSRVGEVWRDIRFPVLAFVALVAFVFVDARLAIELGAFRLPPQAFSSQER